MPRIDKIAAQSLVAGDVIGVLRNGSMRAVYVDKIEVNVLSGTVRIEYCVLFDAMDSYGIKQFLFGELLYIYKRD